MDVRRLIHPGRLPHLGQRIIKTGVAVFICLLIYWIRGFEGLVMQSTVAAIICIQPYRADSIQTSVNRVIGNSAVSYGKTSFQPTLDQVGINTANIDTLYGFFTGYAHFSQVEIDTGFIFAGKQVNTTQATIDGRTIYYLGWRDQP